MNKTRLLSYSTILLSLLLLGFIISLADMSLITSEIKKLDEVVILYVILIYCLFLFSKILRFYQVIPVASRPGVLDFLIVMLKHGFYSSILPARIGDVIYLFQLKKVANLKQHESVPGLLIVRIYDLSMLCVFLLLSVFYLDIGVLDSLRWMVVLLLLIAILSILNLVRILSYASRLFGWVSTKYKYGFVTRISQFLSQSSNVVFSHVNIITHSRLILGTLVNWLCLAVVYYLLLTELGLDIVFIESMFLVSLINLIGLLPIQTIGGFGMKEASLTLGLLILGISVHQSASYAILSRFIVFALPVIFALFIIPLSLYSKNTQT